MPKVDYTTSVEIPLDTMWDFIKDFSNWAPMVKGYQTHEEINDKESIWTVRGEFGPFSRLTKFHTTITEWEQRERVAFEMRGLNEPVTGYGVVRLAEGEGTSSQILAEVGFDAGGALGPLINRLVQPWVRTVAEELVGKLVTAMTAADARAKAAV
ncbi:MAG: SRPBCC family protein [Desulfuromonadales bacterium]|nr:SRPBCC family protein [Desulfuromonadales bacterium]